MAEAEKLSLEIKRFIRASRDRVYAAWNDPAQLKKWFGPENVKTRDLIAEVRGGGEFRWDCTDPEGNEVTISVEYREVEPGKQIVFTWQLEDDADGIDKSSKQRRKLAGVGVSPVKNGKIIREEFLPGAD